MRRVIETLSLFLLLGVVVLRPLIAETYDSAGSAITAALDMVHDPSPARTLSFDLTVLLATLGWFLARAKGPCPPYRRTGLEWGAALVLVAAVASCLAAGNKRLAINGSIDWLCYPVLAIALVQLMTRPWHRRLLLAAVLASACVQAVECLEQYTVGFDDTWRHYRSIKQEFWAAQGVDLDSPKVELFERRIQAREATGFLPHSNVTGAYLVLCGLAGVAAAIARWKGRRRGTSVLPAAHGLQARAPAAGWLLASGTTVVAGLITGAAIVTKSLGAWVSGVAGLAVWLIVHRFGSWIRVHRVRAIVIGWVCALAGGTAVVGYGLSYDSLPGVSLTFRWQWWRASADLIADHALTGVGRENFARHYLQYKPIESPEEVANPHNLLVQAAADWGVLGLIGVATMLVGGSLVVARPTAGAPRVAALTTERRSCGAAVAWTAGLTLVVTLGRLPLLGANDPNFLYYSTVMAGLPWLLGFLCMVWPVPEGRSSGGSGSQLLRTGVAVALFTFVLHDMINFAAFVPGTATTFFALFAFCVAEGSPDQPTRRIETVPGRWLPVGTVGVVLIGVVYVGVLPVGRSMHALRLAQETARWIVPGSAPWPPAGRVRAVNDYFQRAAKADPLDPTPHVERARWLVDVVQASELRGEAGREVLDSLSQAIQRDPFHLRLRRMQIQLYQRRASAQGRREDYQAAIDAARRALALYPQDPYGLATLADTQFEAGEALSADGFLRNALENYHRALKLDDRRLTWERLHRFSARERHEIEAKIERARGRLRGGRP